MAGMHKEEFKGYMNNEIETLEELKTFNIMVRKHLPWGVNILPSTWAFDIKRYPEKRFCKFKSIFFVRVYFQQ